AHYKPLLPSPIAGHRRPHSVRAHLQWLGSFQLPSPVLHLSLQLFPPQPLPLPLRIVPILHPQLRQLRLPPLPQLSVLPLHLPPPTPLPHPPPLPRCCSPPTPRLSSSPTFTNLTRSSGASPRSNPLSRSSRPIASNLSSRSSASRWLTSSSTIFHSTSACTTC